MRILVVEDEYKLADLIQTRLKKENYIVDIALDGEEGLFKALSDYTKYSVYEYADDNKKTELLKLEWRYIEEEKKVLLNEIFMNELNLEKNIPRIDEKCLYYYETANNGRDRLHILWPYNSNFIYIIDENF